MALGFYHVPLGDMLASVTRGMDPPEGYKGWQRCSFCGLCADPAKPLLRCGRCKKSKTPIESFYCNKECQRSHWPFHKYVCGIQIPIQLQESLQDPTTSAEFKILQRWHAFYHVIVSWATLQAFKLEPDKRADEYFLQIDLKPDPNHPNVKKKPRIIIESFYFVSKSEYPSGKQFACFRGEENPGSYRITTATRPKPECCYAIKYESIMAFGRPLYEDMTSSPDLFMVDHIQHHKPCPQWPWLVADIAARGLQASEATATHLALQAIALSSLGHRPGNLLKAWQAPDMSEPFEPDQLEEWRKLLAMYNSSDEKDQKKVIPESPPCDCDQRLDKWRKKVYS